MVVSCQLPSCPRDWESSQTAHPKRDPSVRPCPLSNARVGVSSEAPAAPCVAKEREEGKDASGTGWVFFQAFQPNLSAFCLRRLAKAVLT